MRRELGARPAYWRDMSIRHKLRRLRENLFQEQALAIHAPALERLTESRAREQQETWGRLRAEYGDGSDASTSRRLMVGAIAVLPVLGVLQQKPNWYTRWGGGTSTEELEAEFKACLGDQRVKRIVFFCDSPGGTALGNEELWQTIFAARGTKPIDAFVRGMCASACYYVASACSRIVASPSSVVGSIGTIQVQVEFSKAYAEMGIKPTVITHGENKGAGNSYEPLSPAAKAQLQKTVDDFGLMFVHAVGRGRGVPPGTVLAKFGQGAIFLAEEAQQRGLIDGVQSWDLLLAQLQSDTSAAAPDSHSARSALPLVAAAATQITPESSNVAGASAAVSSHPVPPAAAPQPGARTKEALTVNKKIKAALFARGLIGDLEASDDVCKGVLAGWFAGQAMTAPTDEAAILSALNGAASASAPAAPAANVQSAHDREMAEARVAAVQTERARIADLGARGKLLNISQAEIDAAIASGKPTAEVIDAWTAKMVTAEKPITAPANVTGDGQAAWMADTLTALQLRMGHKVEDKRINASAQRLQFAPLHVLAQQALQLSGTRINNEYDREEVIAQAMAADATRLTIGAEVGGAVNRPANFPNLLSALANKILDEGMELAEPTYDKWCGRRASDLPDFKPSPIIGKQVHDELDEVMDAEAFKEFGLAEECLAYMQLGRFGNKFCWTPVMYANDDLDAFAEGLLGLANAHENALNRLCLKQVAGNVALLDTFSLYDNTNHGNDITGGSGAAPSDAQWQLMLNKTYAQRPVGAKGYIRGKLGIALIPPQLERAAVQTFVKSYESERKSANADSSINIYRGQVDVVIEPELQNYSALIWYGFMRPQGTLNATVIYSYFRGWGRNGKRERWYDPNNKCFYISLEGRFGAAPKQYRTTVRNPGA